jgi:inosine-uridine nucleoside N-ribohydrolase
MLRRIILDVDTGIDDALAILLAVRSPEIKIDALTTVVGNVSLEKVLRNTLNVLQLEGVKDVPVYGGLSTPLVVKPRDASVVHGGDGLADTNLPAPSLRAEAGFAPDIICERILDGRGDVTLVTTGPLTNLAAAILKEPVIAKKVKLHVMMGGAFFLTKYGQGNVTPVSEFNIWHDPEAAKVVFDSGLPTVAVGLDVTTDPAASLKRSDLAGISNDGGAQPLVRRLCEYCLKSGGYLHDPMAVAYLLKPDLFTIEEFPVDVELHGSITRGQTVADSRSRWRKSHFQWSPERGAVKICTKVDGGRFLKLFMDRLGSVSRAA